MIRRRPDTRPRREIPADWLAEFEAAARRPLETRLRYAFIRTYKPVMDDAPFVAFDTMADYRRWCEENLPDLAGLWPDLNIDRRRRFATRWRVTGADLFLGKCGTAQRLLLIPLDKRSASWLIRRIPAESAVPEFPEKQIPHARDAPARREPPPPVDIQIRP